MPLNSPVVVEIHGIEVAEGADTALTSAPLMTVKFDPKALLGELFIPMTSIAQERLV